MRFRSQLVARAGAIALGVTFAMSAGCGNKQVRTSAPLPTADASNGPAEKTPIEPAKGEPKAPDGHSVHRDHEKAKLGNDM